MPEAVESIPDKRSRILVGLKRWAGRAGWIAIGAFAKEAAEHASKRVLGASESMTAAVEKPDPGVAPVQRPRNNVVLSVKHKSQKEGWHGVPLFGGHTDYVTSFSVTLINWNVQDIPRLTLQLTSNRGVITQAAFPPVLNPTIGGKRHDAQWVCGDEDDARKDFALELDMPPVGSFVTGGIVVLSRDRYVSTNDVVAFLRLDKGYVQTQSK